MKLSVLIPSRGRPLSLLQAVLTLHLKVSGLHEVQYVIGCDAGDDETIGMALALWRGGLPVIPRIGARQSSLGGLVNMLAEKSPADVYTALGDDIEVQTKGWDSIIAEAWKAKPDGLWWWCSNNDSTFAIVSEKWRAAAGQIFTDLFPFWYDDIYLIEVQRYATGRKGDRIDVWLQDRAPGTHRMRDLAIWDEFFWWCRDRRKAEARRIAERLGLPHIDTEGLDLGKNPKFNPAAIEASQGERDPPTPEYLAVLGRAKAMMAAA